MKSKGRKSISQLFRPVIATKTHLPSNGLLEKTGTNASRTSLYAFHGSRLAVNTPNLLKIGVPYLQTLIVCVADFVAHHRFLSTYLANSRHTNSPL